jgi:cell division septation protein DedD
MKKCPQCEFIYEDDQSLCDMDGVLLVFDSRTLPNLHALATVSAPIPDRTSRRNRMVPAFATLILMVAVASVYYLSTMPTDASEGIPPVSITNTSAAEAPAVIPPAPTPVAEEKTTERPRETHATPTSQPARKVTTTSPETTKAKPKKEDSKVGSILKKTGKILKKPFKL